MRALSLLLLDLVLNGCSVNPCKAGTLLIDVELSAGAESADALSVEVSTGGVEPIHTRLDHSSGVSTGRIEVEFPSGYPAGASVTVTLTAMRQGQILGRTQAIVLLRPACDFTTIAIAGALGSSGGRGGAPDGGQICPSGDAPNPATMSCENPVPADPEFKGTTAWILGGGAVIDPTAPGLDDLGQLIFDRSAICSTGGTARQRITLPSFANSGRFALNHTVRRDCTTSGFGCAGGNAAVRFRDGALVIPTGSAFVRGKTCLGARAYDGTFELVVAPGDKSDCNDPMLGTLDLRVDRLSILPEPNCPDPGSVKDGNFDGDANAWQLQLNNGTATIDSAIGAGGSQAGHVTTSRLCQSPKLRGTQSVPLGPQVALSLLIKGTAGKAALIGEETNLARWASVTGTGVFETPRVCVPEYAKGMVLPLLLSTETPQGACSTLDVRDFVFDDLSFVTEPSCPMTTSVIDPGFERHFTVAQWNLSVSADGGAGQASATVVNDAAQAHAGTSSLRLSSKQFCTSAHANTVITVPQPTATAGPAIQFYYRAPIVSNTIAFATVQTAQVKLTASASWRQLTLCLDPARAGQGQYFEVVLGSSGICSKSFAEEFAFFDDFAATTDPSCPTK